MPLAMTPQQARDFDEKGFTVLDEFLGKTELDRLLQAIDEVGDRIRVKTGLGPDDPFAVRNALTHHEAFLDLIDHPRMLPLVVDAIGWNIQVRTTHLDYRPPYPEDLKGRISGVGKGEDHAAGYRNVGWHPDLASDDLFMAPSLDGRLPFMEVKVFYVLYDMTESNCGNLWLVPGSHRRRPAELHERANAVGQAGAVDPAGPVKPEGAVDPAGVVNPEGAVELKLPIGSAVLWRTAVWHCVGPNLSRKTRKIMHVGYHYRWLRPTDFDVQDPGLVERCSPVRRQLLGALAPQGDPMGPESDFHPASRYWLTDDPDDVPLREWVQAKEKG